MYDFGMGYINKINQDMVKQANEALKENNEALKENFEREEKYKNNVLNTLINIEKNTDNLNNLVELIKDSNEKQDEIINIINELLLLSKETDREQAVSKYKKIMNKINNFAENVDSYNKLITFGTTIYTLLHANGII